MKVSSIISQNTGHSLVSHRSEFQHVMTEIRNNPVKFLEENLILNPQCYAHHDETSLITVNITREDGLLRLKETEDVNRPGFPGECFICELRLPDHRFRWKHNKLFLLL
ncbi:hypothetical protein NEO93_16025, partial [Escherichia coli]|nr:hypothetical protein [Escherichia coli]